MFIITKEKAVRTHDIIGVFDLDTSTISSITKNFLNIAEKSGEVEGTDNLPKSFILVNKNKTNKIYLSSRLANYISKI